MSSPFAEFKMFVTPDSFEDLASRLDNIGDANEKRIAWTAAMMALNLAHKLVSKQEQGELI
jgi:tetrahydromethanopterin S-methyltransferase subunit G